MAKVFHFRSMNHFKVLPYTVHIIIFVFDVFITEWDPNFFHICASRGLLQADPSLTQVLQVTICAGKCAKIINVAYLLIYL